MNLEFEITFPKIVKNVAVALGGAELPNDEANMVHRCLSFVAQLIVQGIVAAEPEAAEILTKVLQKVIDAHAAQKAAN